MFHACWNTFKPSSHNVRTSLVDTVSKEEASDSKAAIPESTEETEDSEKSEDGPADEESDEDEDEEEPSEDEDPTEVSEDQDENSLSENEDSPVAESEGLFNWSNFSMILETCIVGFVNTHVTLK